MLLAVVLVASAYAETPQPKSATVPVTLDHNRIIIDVRFPMPDGSMKRVRAWVDNGNPELLMTARLANQLGIKLSAEAKDEGGVKVYSSPPPSSMIVGGMTIHPTEIKEARVVDRSAIGPGMSAEINLPSAVLRDYDVIMDYPNRELTIGVPGSVKFGGASAKVLVNSQNALVQVPCKIARGDYEMELDLGSSFSLMSGVLMDQFGRAFPQWPHMVGAVGPANFWGREEEASWKLLRIPSLQFGPAMLEDVGVASLPSGAMDWFQKRAGVPTVGLAGGNAFLNYRVGIDYAHSRAYFEQTAKRRPPEMDVVGLILRPEDDGRYTVIGVADYEGKPSVPQVKASDELISIDKIPAKGGTMGQVWSLLGGSPGDTRELVLQRDGRQFTVRATVRRFLESKGSK